MKMKIGDLEMEQGRGIRFDGGLEEAAQVEVAWKLEGWQLRALAWVAVVVALATLAGAAVTSRVLLAMPAPGLVGVALLAWFLARRVDGVRKDGNGVDDESVLKLRMARVVEVLDEGLSVEDVQRRLGWTEKAVVSTLHALVKDGRVVEDLDLENGHWIYRVSDTWALEFEVAAPLTVAERVEAMNDVNINSYEEKRR
jgi:hypothetical protein